MDISMTNYSKEEIPDFVGGLINKLMKDENLTIDQASKRITFIFEDKEINLFDYHQKKLRNEK